MSNPDRSVSWRFPPLGSRKARCRVLELHRPTEEPMSRVAELADEQMSPDQKRIRDEIAGPRGGHARGPFAIWLRHPALADAANRLGNVLRQKSRLEPRAFELMVLVIARHWSAQYEWHVHEAAARAAGLRQRRDRGDPREEAPGARARAGEDRLRRDHRTQRKPRARARDLRARARRVRARGADRTRSPAPGSTPWWR